MEVDVAMKELTLSVIDLTDHYSRCIQAQYPSIFDRPVGGYCTEDFVVYMENLTGIRPTVTTPHMGDATLWPPQRTLPYFTFHFASDEQAVEFKLKFL